MDVLEIQSYLSRLGISDIITIVGAIILGILAIKVAAKLVKILLLVVAAILLVVFLMSSGVIPSVF